MTQRILRYSALGLAVLTVGAMAACGSSDTTPTNNGTAGAPSGTAGRPAAGSSNPGTAGGAATTAGTSGSTAGSAGTGAGTAGGSAGGAAGVGFACAGGKPTDPLITQFKDLVASATNTGNFTYLLGVPGGTFNYQPGDLTLAVTGTPAAGDTALNIKGTVKGYDGFGLYFAACTDASAYTGVSFNVKGNAGAKLNFRVQSNGNTAVDATNKKGTCVVPAGTVDTYPLCHSASKDIMVTAAGAVVTVSFSELMDGVPEPGVTGADVLGLEWAFDWTPAAVGTGGADGAMAGGPYPVDVTIADVKFIGGAPAGGAGGAGGGGGAAAAGASNGGSGGASAGSGGDSAGMGGASAGTGGASAGSGGAVAGSAN